MGQATATAETEATSTPEITEPVNKETIAAMVLTRIPELARDPTALVHDRVLALDVAEKLGVSLEQVLEVIEEMLEAGQLRSTNTGAKRFVKRVRDGVPRIRKNILGPLRAHIAKYGYGNYGPLHGIPQLGISRLIEDGVIVASPREPTHYRLLAPTVVRFADGLKLEEPTVYELVDAKTAAEAPPPLAEPRLDADAILARVKEAVQTFNTTTVAVAKLEREWRSNRDTPQQQHLDAVDALTQNADYLAAVALLKKIDRL